MSHRPVGVVFALLCLYLMAVILVIGGRADRS